MSEPTEVAPLRILYLDEHFVAVSKPSGMLVHRSDASPQDRVVVLQTLAAQIDTYLYPVHRLDRGTSGILTFGLSSRDAGKLQQALQSSEAAKRYLALTRWPQHRFPLPDAWCMDQPLRAGPGQEPKDARTDFTVVEHLGHFALLEARLHTGRYQQVRRHLQHCARHVIGDTTHGKGRINAMFRANFGLHRLFLHAHSLVMPHPVHGTPIELQDPLPDELQGVLARLRAQPTAAPNGDPDQLADDAEDDAEDDA